MKTYAIALFFILSFLPLYARASVMAEVYQHISDKFLYAVDFEEISLRTIRRVEPEAELSVIGRQVRLKHHGIAVKTFDRPRTPIEWGDVVGASLFQIFKTSNRLSRLKFDEVEWVYINTMLAEMDGYSHYVMKGAQVSPPKPILSDKQISVYPNMYQPLALSPEVFFDADNKILRIRIFAFSKNISQTLRQIILDRLKQTPDLKGVILDMRSNFGGSLEEAAKTVDLFLSAGTIITAKGRHKDSKQIFIASAEDILNNKPIIILVNEGTASSAEVVAASLRDHRRAIIMGTRTFGKGTVQSVIPVNDKHELSLTWARVTTPLGDSIDQKGILPDLFARDSIVQIATKLISDSKISDHSMK